MGEDRDQKPRLTLMHDNHTFSKISLDHPTEDLYRKFTPYCSLFSSGITPPLAMHFRGEITQRERRLLDRWLEIKKHDIDLLASTLGVEGAE